ncbi:MAG: hypothetical protein GXO98_02480, partial [Nitrospirae bacterium]|nr:hypothetical protein [Nitrospirota bacterium]
MNFLVPLFWVIVIIFWIISALAKKQAGTSQEGGESSGEEGYRKPEEAIERFLRRLSGEEEIKVPPPFEPLIEREVSPSQPRMEMVTPPHPKEPVCKATKPPEKKEKSKLCLPGTLDLSTVRQGIILSEILGPPRAERPL